MPHIRSTIRKMAELARKGSHQFKIVSLARRITHHVPSKDVRGELAALYKWVRDHIRYRFDPLGLEWVQSPWRTVQEQAGDCDDMATLLAALAGALGHEWRFDTVGPSANVQQHVAAKAFDGKRWVMLDPVLEPRQQSTAPRDELGRFGHAANGVHHSWTNEGNMLNGATTARDRELWQWIPYYPPVPPTANSIRPMPGAYTRYDARYRSPDAPGYLNGKPITLAFRRGEVDTSQMDGLGRIPYSYNGMAGFLSVLKSVGKVVGKVASAAAPVVSMVPGIGTAVGAGLAVGGAALTAVTKDGKKVAVKPVTGPGGKPLGQQPSAALPGTVPTMSALPLQQLATRDDVRSLANLANKADINRLISKLQGTKAAKKPAKKKSAVAMAVAKVGAAAAARKKPSPALAKKLKKKYGANLKQLYKDGRYFVYKRAAPLSGIRPTLTFSLGAQMSNSPTTTVEIAATPEQRQAAAAMVDALKSYEASHGKPFYGKGVKVGAFQPLVPGLKADGEYGGNTRRAGAWALGIKESAMPRIPSQYANYPVTWQPPTRTIDTPRELKPAPPKPKKKKKPTAAKKAPKAKPRVTPTVTPKPSGKGKVIQMPVQKITGRVPKDEPKKPAAKKKAKPKAPKVSGYKAVAASDQNPGLTPVGAKPAAKPAPSKKPTAAATIKTVEQAARAIIKEAPDVARAVTAAVKTVASTADRIVVATPSKTPAKKKKKPATQPTAAAEKKKDNTVAWLIGLYLVSRKNAA